MNVQEFIHNRNKFLSKMLSIVYAIELAISIYINEFHTIMLIGIALLFLIYSFIFLAANPTLTMYVIIISLFTYFFVLNFFSPNSGNYFLIIFGIIVTTLYHQVLPIIFSGAIATCMLIFFFVTNYEENFATPSTTTDIYFGYFTVLTTIFFIFLAINTRQLWLSAQHSEQIMKQQLISIQEYFQSFFENSNDAILLLDINGTIIMMNDAFERIYGWTYEEAVGFHIEKINFKREERNELLQRVLSGERIVALPFSDKGKHGKDVDAEITLSPIYNDQQVIIAISVIARDISSKKETEARLIQSEKLAVVGEMAAGVAHEIRNPLTVISGFMKIIDSDKNNPYKYYSKLILDELKRINLIISEFLILAKPQAVKYEQVKINTIIEDVILLFQSECNLRDVNIHYENSNKSTLLTCEANQLKQVFINLLKNSIEAMPTGGTIHLLCTSTSNNLLIEVQDDGQGIPSSIIENIGNPFFTTKESGTGLGMMISQKIIQDHKGELSITSKENEGTTVAILLPLQ
ncbi:ATP-binding protein [Bacillus sp. SM2101]|uniref:ATP-binding protein n=1 Tax=Bacillus sp. SM2101 TaxID=2805366 RepID=UPI001BDE2670